MSCQEFWDGVSRPPGGEFSPDAGLQAHLLGCSTCAARMLRERELTAGLRGLAESLGGVKAPARVEARLRSAFRAQSGAVPATWRRPPLPWAWAAAAVVVLSAGLFLASQQQPVPPAASSAIGLAASATSSMDEDQAALEAEGFLPLPSAQSIGPNEGFNLVRVELPRSAMMAVGIPVSAERAGELVEADILLGSDGLARAVRFRD